MMKKKIVIIVLACLGIYGLLLLNNPSEEIKKMGYNHLVNIYGKYQLGYDDTRVLYNPGLRKMNIDLKQARITVILPHQSNSYAQQIENFLRTDNQVLVECSGLDNWHSSPEGIQTLPRLRKQAYRAVIFDGGHHLPTLGLAPDLIIVPVYKGYATHGYMRDGIKVSKLRQLLEKSHSPAVLVTVSRWRLVKTESSLKGITEQVLSHLDFSPARPENITPAARPHISKCNSQMFIYVNKANVQNLDILIKNCRQLGLEEIEKINVAFDYGCITTEKADRFIQTLQKKLSRPAERVNEPVKTSNLIWKL